ncbi:hypothetical protein [Spongiimicrobium salis]
MKRVEILIIAFGLLILGHVEDAQWLELPYLICGYTGLLIFFIWVFKGKD